MQKGACCPHVLCVKLFSPTELPAAQSATVLPVGMLVQILWQLHNLKGSQQPDIWQLPVCADISELNLSKGMSIRFPDGKDKLLVFEITMKPDEGIYR